MTGGGYPTGTVTFVMTDVVGSTQLWERAPDQMGPSLARHEELIAQAVDTCDGTLIRSKGEGDSTFAVFERATDAVGATLAAQRALHEEPWPDDTPIRVRMAAHTGEADHRQGDYYGSAVNRCARLRAVGHGGQALLSQATVDLTGGRLPAGAALKDLGLHRLKDLLEPEHVFQLTHPDLPAGFPPLASLDTVRNNLPLQLKSFVPRDDEIAAIMIRMRDHRLVTLTGAGGSGKTRLALQVAAESAESFPGGVWLIDFGPLSDPAMVTNVIVKAIGLEPPGLGARQSAATSRLEDVVEHLQGRIALLIFDNCEHLLGSCADVAMRLLSACPDLRLLVTSREPLGVEGEIPWRVPSLSLPSLDEAGPPSDALTCQSVRLFVERARAARSDFALTAENLPAVGEIVRRLDGIPLAIELAAARTKVLAPQQIIRMLDDQFRLLTGGSRSALERQQTLRASVEWSVGHCSDEEQTLLRRLAVFAGGATLEAADAVCANEGLAEHDILDLLSRLVDRSLLEVEDAGTHVRYRMLETIRQYARERLVHAGESQRIRDAHLSHFIEAARRSHAEMIEGDGPPWVAAIDREYANLRAAAQWALERGEPAGVIEIGWMLVWYANYRTVSEEIERWLTSALAIDAELPAQVHARALVSLSLSRAGRMFSPEEAGPYAEQAVRLLEDAGGMRSSEGVCALLVLTMAEIAGEGPRHIERALKLSREIGTAWLEAFTLIIDGIQKFFRGVDDRGRRPLEEGIAIGNRIGSHLILGSGFHWLANIAHNEGSLEEARRLTERTITLWDALGASRNSAFALNQLAYLALEQGDMHEARRILERASTLAETTGDRRMLSNYIHSLGEVDEACGDLDAAKERFQAALAIARATDNRAVVSECLSGLARVAHAEGDIALAVELLASVLRDNATGAFAARWLRVLTQILVDAGAAEPSARILGAHGAESVRRDAGVPEKGRAPYEQAIAAARAAIGDESFTTAWEAGERMSLQEAIEYALEVAGEVRQAAARG